MELEKITAGLQQLMKENNYNPQTLKFYMREWNKLGKFLSEHYKNQEFTMERGLAYLEDQYGYISSYQEGQLKQQRVQLHRVIQLLDDYQLYGVLTRRYYASKNPIVLKYGYDILLEEYTVFLNYSELSNSTIAHYLSYASSFLDYLCQKHLEEIALLSLDLCNKYIITMSGFSYKTIEQVVCGLRHFLRFLKENEKIEDDFASKIHMHPISKTAKVPSAWKTEDLKKLLEAVDRNSPIGKRDYAMMLLACVLGLRSLDIKLLTFSSFDWKEKKLSIIQHKTKKTLILPVPAAVGWAVIDYIKNGRPKYYETDIIFLKHMPPFTPLDTENHLSNIIEKYRNKAGLHLRKDRHSGFHSLRHSAASILLENETPLPVITEILGHADSNITAVYLKTDIEKLRECILTPEEFYYE